MYQHILVPVDLAHKETLNKAITVAADLTKHYGATLGFVAVTSSAPSEVAASPAAFADALEMFAGEQGEKHGLEIKANAVTTPDPAVELNSVLDREIRTHDADLVVMASHVPGFAEYVFASNAGYLASHTDVSVMVVR